MNFAQSYEEPLPPIGSEEKNLDSIAVVKKIDTSIFLPMTVEPYFSPASLKDDIITQLKDDINVPILRKENLK